MSQIDVRLEEYCQREIIPQYDSYDKGHGRAHIEEVVQGALELAQRYDVEHNMLYAAAIFHDLGIAEGRKSHHLSSAKMMRSDSFICGFFTSAQIEIIAEAIEDHRASCDHEPRTIYGRILSSADRAIDIDTIIIRAYYYREHDLEQLGLERIMDEMHQHILDKYGDGGYLRLPILTKKNAAALSELRALVSDKAAFEKRTLEIIQSTICI